MKHSPRDFKETLLSLDYKAIREIILDEYDSGEDMTWMKDLMVPAMDMIGEEWAEGKLSLSQVYTTGRIAEKLVDELFENADIERITQPRMAICVLEDFHLLGKRIVYSLLRSAGYSLSDYGQIETEDLIERIRMEKPEILMISTLMLPSALRVADVVKVAREMDIKVVVGGAPFRLDPDLWKEVGADHKCDDASEIFAIVREVKG
jgi:methanogenic corrinoid protein MtbC1